MPIYNIENRDVKMLQDGIAGRTFWGKDMLLAIVDLDAHSAMAVHRHPHEQVGMVVSGEVVFILDGEEHLLKAGDVYVVPGNVPHGVRVGDTPARLLDVFHPVREDLKY